MNTNLVFSILGGYDMIFEKVKELIVEQLMIENPDEITMNTSFSDDLEADSLDLVELIMAIEDEFNLSVEDEEVENCVNTVGVDVNTASPSLLQFVAGLNSGVAKNIERIFKTLIK